MEKELTNRISKLRTECEHYFYVCSPYVEDKSVSEKLAQVLIKEFKQQQISFLEETIKLCDNGLSYKNRKSLPNFVSGIKAANGARKETHENQLIELKKDIEIFDLNLL